MFLRALGFFLLLDGGDDSPGSTTGTDDVLVRDGKKITLVDGKLASKLGVCQLGGRAREGQKEC